MLGRVSQAWSALYDHLALSDELEAGFIAAAHTGESPMSMSGLSDETKRLTFSTMPDIRDYFRERRDYIEELATLDLVISVEREIRGDLDSRRSGAKSRVSALGSRLLAVPDAPGQVHPAARRLLREWMTANAAVQGYLQAIDEAMQYRNWLVHGSAGTPPLLALNPFLLDEAVVHVFELINSEL